MNVRPDSRLLAVVAAAPAVSAEERERYRHVAEATAIELRGLALATCHRVELVAADSGDSLRDSVLAHAPDGANVLAGDDAAAHVVSLAVGLESAVLAEDQVLHQLRRAVSAARGRGRLHAEVETLLEIALRAGRTARSWRPGSNRSLADAALDHGPGRGTDFAGSTVLVVGTGEMGRLAVRAARSRAARVLLASRDEGRAAASAAILGADPVPFDPGHRVREVAAVVVALAGRWSIGPETAALLRSVPLVVDLSQPPALDASVRPPGAIGIDDLAGPELLRDAAGEAEAMAFRRRLEALREERVAEYVEWRRRRSTAAAASSLAGHIERERRDALAALWRRRPDLGPSEQAEIEALTRHLAERLFREPFERLGRDVDGTRERAARDLFGL